MTYATTPNAAPASLPSAQADRSTPTARKTCGTAKTTAVAAADTGKAKTPTKLDLVTEMLARPEGASLEELGAATGWQVHSVRGAMAGALKRKGHTIISDKHEGVRRYRMSTL